MRNRPSYTALKVARGVVWMEEVPEFAVLLPDGAAACTRELLTAGGFHKRWHARVFRMGWHRRLLIWSAEMMMPGQLELLGLRKRFFQDEVRDAIDHGATQVLVVGAGFDSLAVRLAPEYDSVTFFEVDHPPTQEAKRAATEQIGRLSPNLHFVPADLCKTTLGDALGSTPAWSTDARTVVVAEGVLMYLAESDVIAFFEEVRRGTGEDTRVVFSHVREDARGRAQLGRMAWMTRLGLWIMRESMQWAISDLAPFLAAHDLRRLPPPERSDLGARYAEQLGAREVSAGIELFAVVTFGEAT